MCCCKKSYIPLRKYEKEEKKAEEFFYKPKKHGKNLVKIFA